MPRLLKRLLHPLEAAGALVAYGLLRLLPVDAASRFGASVFSTLGPWLRVHAVARRNLEAAFPEKDPAAIDRVLAGMWRNLGRTAGEFPHLRSLLRDVDQRVEIVGRDIIDDAIAAEGPTIFVSAHQANWEMIPLAATHLGIVLDVVYRAPDNPWIAPLFENRRLHPDSRLIPKGSAGGRAALASLNDGRALGMLVDQKMNDGIEARFFGRKAMTAPAFAQLARRFGCPVVPVRIERLDDGVRFRVTAGAPIPVAKTDNANDDVADAVQRVNDLLESWIRERPEQWLWVHRRWPKE